MMLCKTLIISMGISRSCFWKKTYVFFGKHVQVFQETRACFLRRMEAMGEPFGKNDNKGAVLSGIRPDSAIIMGAICFLK